VSIDGKSKDGTWLKDKNGKIQQGTITGCGKGILVAGDGGHYVHHVNTTANATHGIAIESANNKVKHNTSSGNLGNGIWLSDAGSNNVVSKNTTNDNGASGIRLASGSGSNQIDTGDLGILIEDYASSIEDDASSNDITKNEASGNSIFDMMDENAACGGNLFSNNEFGTQSDPCNLVVSPDGTYDPVLHWEFEGSGESILDSSGYGNDAPIQEGQRILDGERGQVLYLNGSHSRITSTINGLNVEFPFR
jgi:parallel beta-helix repeat protein